MVVDSSALIAVLRREPEAERFSDLIYNARQLRLSAANLLETVIVLAGRTGNDNWPLVWGFILEMRIEVAPVTLWQTQLANEAFLRFGKGRHKAALNFGDCLAYALARQLEMPLLYKGDDFAQTDIRPAI